MNRKMYSDLICWFGRAFEQSPLYWLNLQSAYDLKTEQRAISAQLQGARPLAYV